MQMKYISHYLFMCIFSGMVDKLDESVGLIIEALSRKKMLSNSVIVFASDNGGAAEGFDLNYRQVKFLQCQFYLWTCSSEELFFIVLMTNSFTQHFHTQFQLASSRGQEHVMGGWHQGRRRYLESTH